MEKMALGFEKLTEKMKHSSSEDRESGGHGHNEGKTEASVNPVLIERPGATQTSKLDGKGLRVTIVASHWYEKVVHSLVDACLKELLAKGVEEDSLHLVEVAGAFELPFTAARLINCKDKSRRPDAVICIGCMVEDSTNMCETMSQAVAHGIMHLNVTSDTPVIFGVLCCASESQAQSCTKMRSCCGIDESHKCNHGVSFAQSALQMAHLKRCSSAKEMEQCCCTRCVGPGKSGGHKVEKHESSKVEKHESSKVESCTSCKSSAGECSCKDCKCHSCCAKREACRSCGCPPDKCSCHGEKTGAVKTTSSGEHGTKQEVMKSPSTERAGHEESSSSSGRGFGQECARCGSPGGTCKCGLLH